MRKELVRFRDMRRSYQLAAALLLAGCAANSVAPLSANPVLGVVISVTVPGKCIVGGCDPPSADRHSLGLITIRNTSASTAFLQPCGSGPAIGEQEYVNGRWENVGPAVTCALPNVAIPLAAGDSLRFNEFFAVGTRRITLGVASAASLADVALDTSASFEVR